MGNRQALSSADKCGVVLATARLNEHERGEDGRAQGRFVPPVQAWRARGTAANATGPRDPSTAPRVAAPGPGLGRGGRTPAAPQKSPGAGGRGRGARGDRAARQPVITGIAEAGPAGARRAQACQTRGLTRRTVPRWRAVGAVQPDGRAAAPRPIPAQALSPAPGPTGRHRPPSGVDLGEHRPGYDRPRALLLPRPDPRPLQPQERRLGGP